MAITYNDFATTNVRYIQRATSGGTVFSASEYGNTDFDYFTDTAVVNDAIYFAGIHPTGGNVNRVRPFHNLKVYVGTPLVASSITLVWEYRSLGGAWTPLEDVVNGDAFLSSGEQIIEYKIPEEFSSNNSPFSPNNPVPIRCRITAVSGITEGGANSTQEVEGGSNIMLITDEAVTPQSLYNASVSNSWDVIDKKDNMYTFRCSLQFAGTSSFTSLNEVLVMTRQLLGSTTFTLGRLQNDFGVDGSFVLVKTRVGNASFMNDLSGIKNIYGSTIIQSATARTVNPLFGVLNLVDSNLGTNQAGNNNASLEWDLRNTTNTLIRSRIRSRVGVMDVAMGNATTEDTRWFGLAGTTNNNPTWRKLEVDGLSFNTSSGGVRTYNLVDCIINGSISYFVIGTGSARHTLNKKSSLTIRVKDVNGNAIVGATVDVINSEGTTVFTQTTDSNGFTNLMEVIFEREFANKESGQPFDDTVITNFTPHQIIVTADGYQTKQTEVDMSTAKENAITMEKQVDTIIARGQLAINPSPENSQSDVFI